VLVVVVVGFFFKMALSKQKAVYNQAVSLFFEKTQILLKTLMNAKRNSLLVKA
jgi:hypothetical protein